MFRSNTYTWRGRRWTLFVGLVFICSFGILHGAVLNWSGGGGADGTWNNSANWGFAGVPSNGDTLIFPGGVPGPNNTNNISSLTLSQIRFTGGSGGYTIRGNPFTLTNAIAATNTAGANTIAIDITLGSIVTMTVSNTLTLSGQLLGPGGFTKLGAGTLILASGGGNDFFGNVTVTEGILQLSCPPGEAIHENITLTIGDGVGGLDADVVRYTAGNQINSGAQIVINSTGLLDLNGQSDAVGNIALNGGHITTGAGTLTLAPFAGVAATSSALDVARISGSLDLGGAIHTFTLADGTQSPDLIVFAIVSGSGGLTKVGQGEMSLRGANTYSGVTTVQEALLEVDNSSALGSTNGGTVVNDGASLIVRLGSHVGAEPLTLTGNGAFVFGALQSSLGSNSWAGQITLTTNCTVGVSPGDILNVSGIVSGTGNLTKTDLGTLILSGPGSNSYAGATIVNAGTLALTKDVFDGAIPGALIIGDGTGGVNADVVQTLSFNQIANSATITIASSGLFNVSGGFDGVGGLNGSGNVTLGNQFLDFYGNSTYVFNGVISGSGHVTFLGVGTQTFNGNNTYSGTTTVATTSTLQVNGSQPQSDVFVDLSGTLSGVGTIGALNGTGNVAPGNSPGILNCSNVTFASSGDYFVELTGPAPGVGGYDQLNVHGTVSLGNAVLHLTPAFTTPVGIGSQFVIIENDGGDLVTGTFNGLPDGSVINLSGYTFLINYGNDVLLTLTNVPGASAGFTVTAGNGDGVIQSNECNNLTLVITNTTAAPMTGVTATLSSATPGAVITQPYSAYANVPGNGKSTNATTFQLLTLPSLSCAGPINLNLTLTTASHGAFTMPVVLPVACPPGGGNGMCELCPNITLFGAIGASDPAQFDRLSRNGFPSSCASPTGCPGSVGFEGASYEAFTFRNGPSSACITVSLTSPTTDVFSAAYLGAYDPNNLCGNYLADAGNSTGEVPNPTYSFNVGAGAVFVVVVNNIFGSTGPYQLSVTGGDCRPVLNVNRTSTNRVILNWTTAAGGYQLESSNILAKGVGSWSPVTNIPIVVSNRYQVTNNTGATSQFYRLRKPMP